MPEKTMEKLGEAVGRRGFLGTLSAAAAALVLSLVGARPVSAIVQVACCNLCFDPQTCAYAECACQWNWTCEHSDGTCRRCWECYSIQAPCGPACSGVKCSRAATISCDLLGKPPREKEPPFKK